MLCAPGRIWPVTVCCPDANVPVVETLPLVFATVNAPSTSIPPSSDASPDASTVPAIVVFPAPNVPLVETLPVESATVNAPSTSIPPSKLARPEEPKVPTVVFPADSVPLVTTLPVESATVNAPSTSIPASADNNPLAFITPSVEVPVTPSVPLVDTLPVESATVNAPSTSTPPSKEARPETFVTPSAEVPVTLTPLLKVASPLKSASWIEPVNEPDNEPSASALVVVPLSFTSSDVNLPPVTFNLVFLPLPEVSLSTISFTIIVSTSSLSSNTCTLFWASRPNFLLPVTPIPPILIDLAPIAAGVLSDFFLKLRPSFDEPTEIPIPPRFKVLPTNQRSL